MPEFRVERRAIGGATAYRAEGVEDRYLEGYAAKFGAESAVLFDPDVTDDDGEPIPFVEVIDPGAFDRTLREMPDVRALFNHDTSSVLGRTKSGTLALEVDPTGLKFRVRIPNTRAGLDAIETVGRGDMDGCSFGFSVVRDRIELRPGLPALRTLLDINLFEITPATAFPAYEETEVAVRARMGTREASGRDAIIRHQWEGERLRLGSLRRSVGSIDTGRNDA